MRALILYSKEGRLGELAKGLSGVLRKGNCHVQLMEAEPQASNPISGAPYDLVILGSPTLGFFGGKIAEDLVTTSARLTRLEGKKAAAFVSAKLFGAGKSLKAVMALLEKQGAMVEDFATLQSQQDIEKFGQRLLRLIGR
jgi:menaquinone-dependent protoporphyrinogen IX oxidase